MATYSTTFSGQTTGANSTNFTDRYTSETAVSVENPAIGEQDSRVLQFGTGDSGWIFQSFDDVDGDANRADSEILMRYRISADAQRQGIATLRASGSAGSETCYTIYVNNDDFTIARFNSGSGVVVGSAVPTETFPLSHFVVGAVDNFSEERANEWHWLRARVNGTGATVTIQGKWWRDGYDEPEDWTIEATDSSASRITAAGWTGFSKRTFSGISYLDYMGVGTNGDTAPDPSADTSNTLRVTNVHSQVLHAGDSANRVTNLSAQVLHAGDSANRVTNFYAQVLYETPATAAGGQTIVAMISC
jgi:hypothetical protein